MRRSRNRLFGMLRGFLLWLIFDLAAPAGAAKNFLKKYLCDYKNVSRYHGTLFR